jgi:hypothetical protein
LLTRAAFQSFIEVYIAAENYTGLLTIDVHKAIPAIKTNSYRTMMTQSIDKYSFYNKLKYNVSTYQMTNLNIKAPGPGPISMK